MRGFVYIAWVAMLTLVGSRAHAGLVVAFDNASNYATGWTNNSNGGYGFNPWNITLSGGGSRNIFIGNPNAAGITDFGTNAFSIFANPTSSTARVYADRSFISQLGVGHTFHLDWAVNLDAGGGSKGFSLYSGGAGASLLLDIGHTNAGAITFNNIDTGIAYGTGPMTWSFTMMNPGELFVSATGRDGNTNNVFSTTVSVSGSPDAFRLYAGAMSGETTRQPYYNNFAIIVPEPGAMLLMLIGLAGARIWRRRAGI